MDTRRLTVIQMLPALESGGVEKGTLEVARRLVEYGHRSIVISAGGRLLDPLLREGSEHITWDVGRKAVGTLRYIPSLRALFRVVRPDILHLRSRFPAWIGWLAWRSLPPASRPHLVTTVHGPYSPGRYSGVMVRGERVIAISQMIRDYILDCYPRVDPANIRLIHRGVDAHTYPRGFKPSAHWLEAWYNEYPQLKGKFVVTLPARLTRWKGQEQLIEIMRGLRAYRLPVHALIVGEAHPRRREYERRLRLRVNHEKLIQNVTFTGHRSDLREIMAVSDVVLSLSLVPEAFGRVTLEALAMGIPVAGYDHGGVGEQLAALLPQGRVAPGDIGGMTRLMAEWYGVRPAVTAPNPFTLERMLAQTLAVYHELAAG